MISSRTESRRQCRRYPAVLAAILTLSGPGCASLTLLNFKNDKIPTADAEHPAIEILAIWQAAEGPGVGGIPTRGFAGQIFFFNQDRATPVAVDGKARVYVFDDHGTAEEQARPLHQFDFDRASWTAHLQNSKIGPTYGVFIPYSRSDYHQAVCSLRLRFTPPKGRPLYSASSTIVLPGPPLKPQAETAQVSPLSGLARQLQAQSQPRPWRNPAVATDPGQFNTQLQGAATQLPAPASVAAPGNVYSTVSDSTVQAPQGGRFNPIIQTAGTAAPALVGAPPDSVTAAGYSVGSPDMRPTDAAQPSGRIKLRAAVTNANWSSESDGSENADDLRSADAPGASSLSHPNHPLAD